MFVVMEGMSCHGLFWIIICSLSVIGTYTLFMGSWYNYENSSVRFLVSTSYLKFDTAFPAISICEDKSPEKGFAAGLKLYGPNRNLDLDVYLQEIAFFTGTCNTCKKQCGVSINCSNDFDFIFRNVLSPCVKFLKNCSWNGKPFDCCSKFLPLKTEYGKCFTINSLLTESSYTKLHSNLSTGPGRLEFHVFENAKMFLHSPEDVPFSNHLKEEISIINRYSAFTLTFMVTDLLNDPLLTKLPPTQRKCIYPRESNLLVYKYYSYSTCVVECRMKAQIELCNCTNHMLPTIRGVRMCDVKGVACLADNAAWLTNLQTKGWEQVGLVCDCMSSCEEPEYNIVRQTAAENDEDLDEELDKYPSKVIVAMAALPSVRFWRYIFRSRLDLVVSFGGTAGLFLGASVLSILECVAFMFFRKESTDKDYEDRKDGSASQCLFSKPVDIFISTTNQSNHGTDVKLHRRNIKGNKVMPYLN